jgi:hypothetical protein
MHQLGMRPDFISFADLGAEKKLTYRFQAEMTEWIRDVDFPEPTVCIYEPKDVTTLRYKNAVIEVLERLKIAVTDQQLVRLSRIYGNMVANQTLPGIAFGLKSCSIKWKLEAQEPI